MCPQALQQKWLKSRSLALRWIISSVFEVWHLGQIGAFEGFRGVEGMMVLMTYFMPSLISVKSTSAAIPDVWQGITSFNVTGDNHEIENQAARIHTDRWLLRPALGPAQP
jgi:hypothetical protein